MKERFAVGVWRADPRHNVLESEGRRVRVDPKAMRVLVYLAERAGEDVSKGDILGEVWDGAIVNDEVLTNAIWELRKALGDDSRAPEFIQTVPRKGYRLIAPVERDAPRATFLQSSAFVPTRQSVILILALALVTILLVATALVLHLNSNDAEPSPVVRLEWTLPHGQWMDSERSTVAISPDGDHLVYRGWTDNGRMLYHRALNRLDVQPISGTEDVVDFSLSPDGRWVVFWAEPGRLSKVPLDGGPATTIAEPIGARAPAWGPDDMIYFSAHGTTGDSGLMRISASGGDPEAVTELDSSRGEWAHRFPHILPEGNAVVFAIADENTREGWHQGKIAVVSLETGERRTLIAGSSYTRYIDGFLVYITEGGTLRVSVFDADRLEIAADSKPVVDRVLWYQGVGDAHFDISRNGTLVYVAGPAGGEASVSLLEVQRNGESFPLTAERRAYSDLLALSPDNERLAVIVYGNGNDIWAYDMSRGTFSRITHSAGDEWYVAWSPGGEQLSYGLSYPRPNQVFTVPADGSGAPTQLVKGPYDQVPNSWSPDGSSLVIMERNPETGWDLLLYDAEMRETRPLIKTEFDEVRGMVSPDGRWLAYKSNDTGRDEIYVTTFPSPGRKWQISADGGWEPRWTKNGRELIYRTGDNWMSVSISTRDGFAAGRPLFLFQGDYKGGYDVTSDGQRFIVVERPEPLREITVVVNWLHELKETF